MTEYRYQCMTKDDVINAAISSDKSLFLMGKYSAMNETKTVEELASMIDGRSLFSGDYTWIENDNN